jgi:ribosomal protein L18E
MLGGPPTEQQLKEWDDPVVIVASRLALPRDARPHVDVIRITQFKKPGPNTVD